ncbi:hypothetical protein [Flavobacterium sp. 7A]|uniref:hypothetical protein n=1 Tax=Flavobacterium sp. 7A TaxID=2940571 RepID=UPI002226AE19|nr:hypothetical protein [Flavobacterium sp. 7A]MCW2118762.1 hypothetical protein [Flavobacterium sp. 7A]
MRHFISLAILISFFSCKNSENENNSTRTETELTQKETKFDSKIKEISVEEQMLKLNSEVENTIIYCENDKFIIKIDNLKNGDLRYSSWDKPKSIATKPTLVLYDGKVEKQGTSGGYHYIFKSDNWSYIIENKFVGETAEATGVFLKLINNGKQQEYSKMINLTVEKDYDLKSYSKSNLIGNWFTPHSAVRKVSFFDNGTFIFDEGDGKKIEGKFKLIEKSVTLDFDNGTVKTLKIGRGRENTSLTLVGEGENFSKERK